MLNIFTGFVVAVTAFTLAHLAFFSDIETCETRHSTAVCFQALNR